MFCPFLFIVGPFSGVQNRIYRIIRARIVRDSANDPRIEKNATIKEKMEKIYFRGSIKCFCPFCSLWAIFGGPKSCLPYFKS